MGFRLRSVMFASALLCAFSTGQAQVQENTLISRAEAKVDSSIAWYDVEKIGVEGKGWNDTESYYDRLPARARDLVRKPVWELSRDATGLCVRFASDAKAIGVAWDGGDGMPHMAATGKSGVDLYVKRDGAWRFLRVGKPGMQRTALKLIDELPGVPTEYLLYLPLYNQVTNAEIGVPVGAKLWRLQQPPGRPIVFYGTSITQGGCASRPGMPHTAILGRWLDREIINLGFSGNGRLEPEMAGLLAELDPEVYVIDCIPNVSERIGELIAPFLKIIREKRPETSILLVEDVRPADSTANRLLREAWRTLVDGGDKNLYYLEAVGMIGADGEATVDGRHPSDLGFMRMAEWLRRPIGVLLKDR